MLASMARLTIGLVAVGSCRYGLLELCLSTPYLKLPHIFRTNMFTSCAQHVGNPLECHKHCVWYTLLFKYYVQFTMVTTLQIHGDESS